MPTPGLPTAPPPTALASTLRAKAASAPITIAHRGDPVAGPENTLPAFEAAIAAGTPMIEFDVQATRDGELVVIHDETLDRTTDAAAVLGRDGVAVADVDSIDLRRLDAGRWHHESQRGTPVPTLEEALVCLAGRTIPMIEIKSGEPARLLALLRRLELIDAVLVQSFDWDLIARLRTLEPSLTLGALGEGPWRSASTDRLAATGAGLVHWHAPDLQVEDVADLRAAGYLLVAYTLDSDVELLGGAALGLDGIVTNRPARLLELSARRALLRR